MCRSSSNNEIVNTQELMSAIRGELGGVRLDAVITSFDQLIIENEGALTFD